MTAYDIAHPTLGTVRVVAHNATAAVSRYTRDMGFWGYRAPHETDDGWVADVVPRKAHSRAVPVTITEVAG
ncbi:MAG: hypothetical protein U1E29_18340 [Coriobacteriia bacterium]|nr:hypothetical protein [Coriobacteriia bacterium]